MSLLQDGLLFPRSSHRRRMKKTFCIIFIRRYAERVVQDNDKQEPGQRISL